MQGTVLAGESVTTTQGRCGGVQSVLSVSVALTFEFHMLILQTIKGQRISWLGHLESMEEDRMPKKIFTQEMEGTRRRGRLRKGSGEEVERDLQVLGVRRWRELVIDRD